MSNFLMVIGNSTAVLGILICLAAGASRILGNFYLFGFGVGTLFIGGIALMVMACLVKLQQLTAEN